MKTETDLLTIRATLVRISDSSRYGGFGPVFPCEIEQIDAAVAELRNLRNGLAHAAKVIEAGESDRRTLVARIASLTRYVENLINNGLSTVAVLTAYVSAEGDARARAALHVYRASFESYRPVSVQSVPSVVKTPASVLSVSALPPPL